MSIVKGGLGATTWHGRARRFSTTGKRLEVTRNHVTGVSYSTNSVPETCNPVTPPTSTMKAESPSTWKRQACDREQSCGMLLNTSMQLLPEYNRAQKQIWSSTSERLRQSMPLSSTWYNRPLKSWLHFFLTFNPLIGTPLSDRWYQNAAP